MRYPAVIVYLLFIVFCFNSCKKDITVPSYIHITPIKFKTLAGQGTDLQNITQVGIFVDDDLVGIYEAPATIPVLKSGRHKVEARAYIKRIARDGLVTTPFFSDYGDTLILEEGKVDTLKVQFGYRDDTKFVWLEDFNTPGFSIIKTDGTLDSIQWRNDPAQRLDTSHYAYMNLGNVQDSYFEIESKDQFELPTDNRDIYLEVHYKTNIEITVGLIAITSTQKYPLPSATPFSTGLEWRKGYVYMRDEVYTQPAGTKFKVMFRCYNGDESIVPEVYLENIKLVYRD